MRAAIWGQRLRQSAPAPRRCHAQGGAQGLEVVGEDSQKGLWIRHCCSWRTMADRAGSPSWALRGSASPAERSASDWSASQDLRRSGVHPNSEMVVTGSRSRAAIRAPSASASPAVTGRDQLVGQFPPPPNRCHEARSQAMASRNTLGTPSE